MCTCLSYSVQNVQHLQQDIKEQVEIRPQRFYREMMSVTEAPPVRASLAPVELPLLTLQLLTQLQYDRDTVKTYYESCKRDLDLHKHKSTKQAERWQQTADELESEVAVLSARAQRATEANNDLELQLKTVRRQLEIAQERLGELETVTEQKDTMLEKQNKEISEKISQIWSGIMPVVQSSEASKAILLQTKENLTAMLRGEDIEKLLVQIEDFMEVMHNNTKLFEPKYAAQQRVEELLDRVKSLEDDIENRSRLIKTFQKYLQNLTLIQDGLLKEHTKIVTVVKDHKSEILRIDTSLSNIFQNFTSSYQKYKEEKTEDLKRHKWAWLHRSQIHNTDYMILICVSRVLKELYFTGQPKLKFRFCEFMCRSFTYIKLMQEKLKKLLNGKYKEDRLVEAGKSGNVADISLLLHFGVDTEARDSSGKTALHLAVENGHLKACEVLLDGGARTEAVATGFEGNTPLYIAAWKGHLDIVRLFVERGAKLSTKNRNGATPLKVARVWNHHQVVKYLEEKGATL